METFTMTKETCYKKIRENRTSGLFSFLSSILCYCFTASSGIYNLLTLLAVILFFLFAIGLSGCADNITDLKRRIKDIEESESGKSIPSWED